MQLLGIMYSPKLTSNIEGASRLLIPFLKSPLSQVVISFGLGYFVITKMSQIYCKLKGNSSKSQTDDCKDKDTLPVDDNEVLPKESEVILLSIKELSAFDGSNADQPIYTALNGTIYDLSPDREKFSSQGPYSHLAGCDANQVLHIACRSMGVCGNDLINRWEQSLRAEFHMVGYLIDSDMEYSGEDVEMKAGIDTKTSHMDCDDLQ